MSFLIDRLSHAIALRADRVKVARIAAVTIAGRVLREARRLSATSANYFLALHLQPE
jgi:hypothetical protein